MGWPKDNTRDAIEERLEASALNRKSEKNARDLKEKPSKSKFKTQSIRLPENYLLILQEHFRNEGKSISGGIRQLLYKYMKDENLI